VNTTRCHKCTLSRQRCSGGSLAPPSTTGGDTVGQFSVIGTPVTSKRRVVPTPKVVAVKAQEEAQKDDAMHVDVPAAQVTPTIKVPPSRKRSAPSLPVESAPSASKLARTSQSSLVQRTPSLLSSTSSRPVVETPVSVSLPAAPAPDPLVLWLNMLEESIRRNHETLAEAMR
jgi:hypothetical protein